MDRKPEALPLVEELFGCVERILFSDEEKGFVIAKIKEPKKRELTTLTGSMPGLQVGESVHCLGRWKAHPKHGPQFEVDLFEAKAPSDLVGIQKYLESGMIKGIGPAYAERIVKKFGVGTLKVIDETPQKLLSIQGIGEKRVETIIRCWGEQREIRSVMIFLRGHGVSPGFAQKIFKQYGVESVAKLKENPYRMARELSGIGFKSADLIAQNLGIEKEAKERIHSGIEHVLWELSGEGHVCYPRAQLTECVAPLLELEPSIVEKGIDELAVEGLVIEDGGFIWVRGLFLSEVGIARELSRIKGGSCALRSVDIPKALAWGEENLRIQFAEQQKLAIAKAMEEKVMVLTGGPGTGKSTITNAILRISEKLTKRIELAAPTGRAAKRLSEITRRRAQTIHSLLEMDFTNGGFKKGKEHPLAADLLIVDESSMIDTSLMHNLLKAVPTSCRVIFVGDIDQLPSVGPGSVLRDLIDSGEIPVVSLTEIFRQAKGSHIITGAHRINQGEMPYLGGNKDFRFVEKGEPEEVLEEIVQLVSSRTLPFDPLKEIQVLCPMKRGIIGTENLNLVLQEKLNPSDSPLSRMGRRFHKSDKVMQIRNNYDKNTFNGDVGFIEEIDHSDQVIMVSFDGRSIPYDFSELDELVLAYAVSIHKYQGSECPCVIIPVHTTHFKLLHRNLLYTGVTRGKKQVILVGSKRAVAIAVQTKDAQTRHTGLKGQILAFSRSGRPALQC